jgi:hypothetical protein
MRLRVRFNLMCAEEMSERIGQTVSPESDLKVFISSRESLCDECGEKLGKKAWIMLVREIGALCLTCADLDHLVFLSAGDAALTRRARKYSTLTAVVLKWSQARKRYERQGLLVEDEALVKAEEECLADSEFRERRREREAEAREKVDIQYKDQFARRVREIFPGCPKGREVEIAQHTCLKHSGRVGRTSSARELSEEAVRLAVIAHVRHRETKYDWLLARGYQRRKARAEVDSEVKDVLRKWEERVPHRQANR